MRTTLALSTYISDHNKDKRIDIFKQCIDSLYDTDYGGNVIIVDDGSVTNEHLKYASQYNLEIIKKETRGGIAKCKNTCIRRSIELDSEAIFLSDDDMLFLSKDWNTHYEEAYSRTKIEHFSYAMSNSALVGAKIEKINNYPLIRTPMVNGCFLFIATPLIHNIGYFKPMQALYGHEHSNFSLRYRRFCNSDFFDVLNSNQLLSHKNALHTPSMPYPERESDLHTNSIEYLQLPRHVEIQE